MNREKFCVENIVIFLFKYEVEFRFPGISTSYTGNFIPFSNNHVLFSDKYRALQCA